MSRIRVSFSWVASCCWLLAPLGSTTRWTFHRPIGTWPGFCMGLWHGIAISISLGSIYGPLGIVAERPFRLFALYERGAISSNVRHGSIP